jgi:hypothetical protein
MKTGKYHSVTWAGRTNGVAQLGFFINPSFAHEAGNPVLVLPL